MLKSALLFYHKLVEDLKTIRFTVNPYEPCMANKVANRKQLTVSWHVDDLKVSHLDTGEVTKIADYIKSRYGDKLTVWKGKVHHYLGMTLTNQEKGVVKISIIPFIQKVINIFPEMITTTVAMPAGDHLFQVRTAAKPKQLLEEQAIQFCHSVAQLLFLSLRAR